MFVSIVLPREGARPALLSAAAGVGEGRESSPTLVTTVSVLPPASLFIGWERKSFPPQAAKKTDEKWKQFPILITSGMAHLLASGIYWA